MQHSGFLMVLLRLSLRNTPLKIVIFKYLEIKNFKGVFSRDTLLKTINKPECGIINLNDSFGGGSQNILKVFNIMIFNIKTLKVFFVGIIVCIS